ncbi:unnamed protein product, partial [Staurois parvus]
MCNTDGHSRWHWWATLMTALIGGSDCQHRWALMGTIGCTDGVTLITRTLMALSRGLPITA